MNDYVKICNMLSDSLVKTPKITGVDMADLAHDTTTITVSCGVKWCQRYRHMSKRRRKKALHLEIVRALNCLVGQPFNQDTHDQAVIIVNDILDNVIRPYTITLAIPPRS